MTVDHEKYREMIERESVRIRAAFKEAFGELKEPKTIGAITVIRWSGPKTQVNSKLRKMASELDGLLGNYGRCLMKLPRQDEVKIKLFISNQAVIAMEACSEELGSTESRNWVATNAIYLFLNESCMQLGSDIVNALLWSFPRYGLPIEWDKENGVLNVYKPR